eukprot:349679-Chlamydomonas_euryale.AAC.6
MWPESYSIPPPLENAVTALRHWPLGVLPVSGGYPLPVRAEQIAPRSAGPVTRSSSTAPAAVGNSGSRSGSSGSGSRSGHTAAVAAAAVTAAAAAAAATAAEAASHERRARLCRTARLSLRAALSRAAPRATTCVRAVLCAARSGRRDGGVRFLDRAVLHRHRLRFVLVDRAGLPRRADPVLGLQGRAERHAFVVSRRLWR